MNEEVVSTARSSAEERPDGATTVDSGVLATLHQAAYRRAFYLLGDRHAAEDAAQESIFRYLSRRPAGLANPVAWMSTVVTRLCWDWLKRGRRFTRVPIGEAENVPDPQRLPEQVITDREDLDIARQVLDSLDPRDRMLLLMRHSSSSYREISAAVGCAASSVGPLLHRAERRFKHAYEKLASPR